MTQIVPKRKVAARVRLSNVRHLDGFFYVAVRNARGEPESVRDRLNDLTEEYLPMALEGRHLLIRKAGIVTVEVPAEERAARKSPTEEELERRRFDLKFEFSDGTNLVARATADLPLDRERPLDYLNLEATNFTEVQTSGRVVLLNGDHVVAVTEVLPDEGAIAP